MADKFRSFVALHPDFAEEYLYRDNTSLHSCGHHAKPSPLAKGICPDFSPGDHTSASELKKHN